MVCDSRGRAGIEALQYIFPIPSLLVYIVNVHFSTAHSMSSDMFHTKSYD